ncbi:membrane protein [Methylopila jiangsuensis]|uniref:Membrane protein n=1 Tax=Methylopila jiangsuensis TaxID=586230 RepID=A0A9W6N309_9HYPH|nr:DUF2852 domain-containing protein [Methylopila jiangsuensis]MDR6286077.1 hypothetical protein [Methylopila jiangsuensis]GLK75835.1 membrane protein [Methylopila jiangsuensis]
MTSNPYLDDAVIPGVPHRWNALTIALMVIGFIVFWPLGLAVIAYVLWGRQIAAWARSAQSPLRGAGDFGSAARRAADDFTRAMGGCGGAARERATGNAAFDAWRASELERLAAERRRVDETTAAFEAHLAAERGAFDDARQREAFERFMRERGQG